MSSVYGKSREIFTKTPWQGEKHTYVRHIIKPELKTKLKMITFNDIPSLRVTKKLKFWEWTNCKAASHILQLKKWRNLQMKINMFFYLLFNMLYNVQYTITCKEKRGVKLLIFYLWIRRVVIRPVTWLKIRVTRVIAYCRFFKHLHQWEKKNKMKKIENKSSSMVLSLVSQNIWSFYFQTSTNQISPLLESIV